MMTDEEIRDELVAWGEYNEVTKNDVSLAAYRVMRERAHGEGLPVSIDATAGVELPPDEPTQVIERKGCRK